MDSQQETYQTTAQQHFYKGHEMKNLIFTLFILCFTGCIPPQETETEWKSDPEYRAFIATRMAESIINYQKNFLYSDGHLNSHRKTKKSPRL